MKQFKTIEEVKEHLASESIDLDLSHGKVVMLSQILVALDNFQPDTLTVEVWNEKLEEMKRQISTEATRRLYKSVWIQENSVRKIVNRFKITPPGLTLLEGKYKDNQAVRYALEVLEDNKITS